MSVVADREYRSMDKTEWGDGPWNDEPDKLQWVDEATGLDCLIVRNPHLGVLCGYVGVAPGHSWHGLSYSADDPSPELLLDVHGGLSYSERCQEGAAEQDGICHVPLPGRPADVWWFGFDCAHGFDVVPGMEARERERGWKPIRTGHEAYRTVAYVQAECARLAQQLAAVGAPGAPGAAGPSSA